MAGMAGFGTGTGSGTGVITTCGSTGIIWNQWVSVTSASQEFTFTTSTNTAASSAIWVNWSGRGSYVIPETYQQMHVDSRSVSKREIRREIKRMAVRTRQVRKITERPKRKAETLLLKHLAREQRRTWMEKDYFDFSVESRVYRIRRGSVGNVELIDDAGIVAKLCCHPRNVSSLPEADVAMSQWMMLKYNEKEFFRLANFHYQRPGYRSAA